MALFFVISIQVEEDNNYEFYLEWLPTFAADLPWQSEIKAPLTIYFIPTSFGKLFPNTPLVHPSTAYRIIGIFA